MVGISAVADYLPTILAEYTEGNEDIQGVIDSALDVLLLLILHGVGVTSASHSS